MRKYFLLVFVACTYLITTSHACETLTPEACPLRTSVCSCSRILNSTIMCCHISSEYKFQEGLACAGLEKYNTKRLLIYNASLDVFESGSSQWNHLDTLTVTGGRIKKLRGQFRGSLSCINFSSNSLIEIEHKAFSKLNKLDVLDLSGNNLTVLPDLPVRDRNFTLDISRNAKILCHSVIELREQKNSNNNLHFQNRNGTYCVAALSFHWFNSTDVIPLFEVEKKEKMEHDCPRGSNYNCTCNPYNVDLLPGQPPTYNVAVDCSSRRLTELPNNLPPNTVLLNVSNNNITSLLSFKENPTYFHIRILLADNNRIESINSLEGSRFIEIFSILSLSDNNLKSLPTYILNRTFDRNLHPRQIKLGENRLNCDCNTAQGLKVFFDSNRAKIPDYDRVFCEKGSELVISLDPNKYCVTEKDWTEYIYYIIAGEVLLLVLLVSKVSYDYWVFKTSGYLPWPASKMPKLPCDWLCET